MTTSHERTAGRVPVALYVAAPSPAAARELAQRCREYAELRNWTIALTATDVHPADGLSERPGWARVIAALSDRTARGVVTWSRDMLADSPEGWNSLTALVSDRNAFLAAAGSGRPTGACAVRRSSLLAVASGWHPTSAR